ncbi:aminotransferase class III-fold pyridoxal phosphate-dependent enzyme [Candidatus Poribacteria bacterium]|nr:aminotransferase class III-fold pyridoxal phosphate-dependent enzyme [Candidatus Poribacteria bacterium]
MEDKQNIESIYSSTHGISKKLYNQACEIFPSGVTHDSRYLKPFPVYMERASGSKKWDVEGNEYIDYWVGHGSLLLGHCRPEVVVAINAQLSRGTHYGACQRLEIEWGQLVKELIPSAEKVKFVSSGTEATLMALRLARTFTGKNKIVKFEGHFHGWHDGLVSGVKPPFDIPPSPGIPKEFLDNTLHCPPNDIKSLKEMLEKDKDIAAVIIEPTGGSFVAIPTQDEFLKKLRNITKKYGVLLIFDEVVTGFRVSPGGAQEYYKVIPDLTALAKVLGGGLPGGAVAGRNDIMEYLEFKDDSHWNRYKKIYHPGTFNANPLSASAGIATLKIVSTGEDIQKANETAKQLRAGMNQVIDIHKVNWCVYGSFSGFKVLKGHECKKRGECDYQNCDYGHAFQKTGGDPELGRLFRLGMLINGIDISPSLALTSSAHTKEDVEKTINAFDDTLSRIKAGSLLSQE